MSAPQPAQPAAAASTTAPPTDVTSPKGTSLLPSNVRPQYNERTDVWWMMNSNE
jgi:hypothetical protein